jgi:AhpC/TSA family
MIPHERSLVAELKNEPFALIGVNSEASLDEFKKLAAEEKVTWPSFFDGGGTEGPIATKWGVRGWPTIYVIDKKGVIRQIGPRDELLTKAVKELLEEQG